MCFWSSKFSCFIFFSLNSRLAIFVFKMLIYYTLILLIVIRRKQIGIICSSKNNIDENVPADIVKGIKYAIHLVRCKFYNCKIIVSGILHRNYSTRIQRNKIRLVNIQKKYAVGKMNKTDVTYIDPDHTWTTSGGTFSTNLYYKDNLHLVEKGKEKLVKAITTPFNVGALKQQQNLSQIGQLNQQKLPQHQQKHHHQQKQAQ